MKKYMCILLTTGVGISLTGCSAGAGITTALLILLALATLAFAGLRTYHHIMYLQRMKAKPNRRKPRSLDLLTLGLYGLSLFLLLVGVLVSCGSNTEPAETTEATTVPTTVETTPPVVYVPAATAQTSPGNWGITWEIFDGDRSQSSTQRTEPIFFGAPEDYFKLPGISTFRGNNYRNNAAYGTANVQSKTLSVAWEAPTGKLPGTTWSGSGWTGQPLIVQWDEQTRNQMNLYPEKKAKSDLVEVIYATLEGKIYFLDLADGSHTRDPLNVGFCFKGAGTLDPRGYPLMYVGAGDVSGGNRPRMFIISLIDGKILFEYGDADALSLRKDNKSWCAFDSAPLIHSETDTLIWPGENGILYTFKLNTNYDAENGTVSISPSAPLLTRYNTARSGEEKYWLGYEASVSIAENYLYVSENGGMFYCVDLNTMELIWAQDTKDDSNASPVFERISEEQGYVYTAPSLHWTKNTDNKGSISLYKLDALTGEIVWEKPYDVYTQDGVSGGVQSTPLLGKPGSSLEGLIIYSISRAPKAGTGLIVALDTQTGAEMWRVATDYYAWSSPVAVYDENNTGYVVLGDSSGKVHFLEGSTGAVLHTLRLNGNVEASPAVFHDILVLGTRKEMIYGIKIN